MSNEDKKQTFPNVSPFTVENAASNPFLQPPPSEGLFQRQPDPTFSNIFSNKNTADLNKEGGQGSFPNSLFNLGNLSTKDDKKPSKSNQTEGLNFGFTFQTKPKESFFSKPGGLFEEVNKSEEISQPQGFFGNLGLSFEAKKNEEKSQLIGNLTEEKSQPNIAGNLFKEETNPAEKSKPKNTIFSSGNSGPLFSKTPQSSSLFGDKSQFKGTSESSNLFSIFAQSGTQNQSQNPPKQVRISEEKNLRLSDGGGASNNAFNFLTNPENQSYAPVFQNLPNESKETSEKIEQKPPDIPKFGQPISFGPSNETKGFFSQNQENQPTGLFGIPIFQSNKKEDNSINEINEKPMKKQKTKDDDSAISRERLEESKSSTFSFQNPVPLKGSDIKKSMNDTPLMQSLEIEPLRFEHELKKPDRELDTWEDSEIFSKFPKYFEENRQEIEKLKTFRSKAWQEIKNIYPVNRVKKYKGLFEEFLRTIDELYIDSEDKNKILKNLEDILLFYENEVLSKSKPRALEDFNFYYKENQEKSLVFEELPKKNEDLVNQIEDLQKQIVLKKAELEEKRKILPKIEIEKNEMVERVSKDLEEALILNKKASEDLENVIIEFDKNSNGLLSMENEIKRLNEQKDPRPLHLMIQDTMNEIKFLIKDKLEPLQKQYIFYKLFVARFDSKIKKLEKKSEELSGIIEKYKIGLENNKDESKKIDQEVKNIEQEKLRIEEIKKMLSLKHEVEKDTWNILYQENVVLLAKKEEQEAKATEEREKINKIQEEIRKKQNDSILQYKIKKNRIANLKKEINELGQEEQVDDESVGKIKSEVDAMRQQIADFEIKRKDALNNKKAVKNSCLEITLFVLILVLAGMVLFKFLNFLE